MKKKIVKSAVSIFLCIALLCSFVPQTFAEPEPLKIISIFTLAKSDKPESRVNPQWIDNKLFLFLPADMPAEAASLHLTLSDESALLSVTGSLHADGFMSGNAIDLTALCGKGEQYALTFRAQTKTQVCEQSIILVPTNGIASMYLVSDDPINQGRVWVESSPDKSNKATGKLCMLDAAGETVYNGALSQIKGRGNSTWADEKKPYQIKLASKTDLLQSGAKVNAAKTWVLLTNHADASLLRNNIVYDLSVAMGIDPGIECRPVNLYYDGEYRGSYLLCEKVEINPGRVDISDLEDGFEDANPEVEDFDKLVSMAGITQNGASYVYCKGMSSPTDFSGGYLLEMDTPVRAQAEKCHFTTKRGQCIVVKSPEYCSEEAMRYIATYYQEFEDTLFNKGKHPSNGKTIDSYVDVKSVAACYIINELTKNSDAYRTSSFFYKDAGSDGMTMGPVWDYDLSFGVAWGQYIPICADPTGFFALHSEFCTAFYELPAFRQQVHDIYTGTVAPLLEKTLLAQSAATDESSPLQSIPAYCAELSASAAANALVWGRDSAVWQPACDTLKDYIGKRHVWLKTQYADWSADSYTKLTGYLDVPENVWYYEPIMQATEYGLLHGMEYGIFSPEGNATRAQATQVLYSLSGAARLDFSAVFSDVRNSDWFAPAVMWAHKSDVVNGYDDGTFRPQTDITRQDMVVLLYRYLGKPIVAQDTLTSFEDGREISDYAKPAFRWAVANGILKGYEDNTLRPKRTITRAELAAIIVRYYEKFILAEH